MPKDHRKRAIPYFALGAAFFTIGLATQRVFIFVGVIFWVIGLRMLLPPRR